MLFHKSPLTVPQQAAALRNQTRQKHLCVRVGLVHSRLFKGGYFTTGLITTGLPALRARSILLAVPLLLFDQNATTLSAASII